MVGYGAIGRRVATALVAMGAHVQVFDRYFTGALPEGVEQVGTLDELLRRSNVLSLHARATAENAGMIGREQLAMLPEGAIVVNCARPQLLDYDALCDALDDGHLFAAACDVLPSEPLPPDHRILRTSKITVTPHLAGASKSAAWIAARLGCGHRGVCTGRACGEPAQSGGTGRRLPRGARATGGGGSGLSAADGSRPPRSAGATAFPIRRACRWQTAG